MAKFRCVSIVGKWQPIASAACAYIVIYTGKQSFTGSSFRFALRSQPGVDVAPPKRCLNRKRFQNCIDAKPYKPGGYKLLFPTYALTRTLTNSFDAPTIGVPMLLARSPIAT